VLSRALHTNTTSLQEKQLQDHILLLKKRLQITLDDFVADLLGKSDEIGLIEAQRLNTG
jgi:hypothetical protein